MTDVRSAWNEAGERLQGLGATLKQHYEQQRGEDPAATKEQVGDAFKRVGEALQGAFEALGAAAKDPAVKEDVRQTGRSVADALTVTFTELSDDVRRAFDKRKGEARPDGTDADAASASGGSDAEAPPVSPSTAAPAGPQESGVDGGTAPPAAPEPPAGADRPERTDPSAQI